MNKKLLLVLLLVAVLALSLAVVGCKSADTPQESIPSNGGEVIEHPNEGENDPPSEEVEYYEDRVLVVLEHQASIDSLALDSLLDLNWGEEVVEVKPRYLYRDEVVKRHLDNGELEDQKVVDYQRSLYLTLADSNDGRVDELIAQLPLREDVLTAEKVPVIVSKMISLEEQQQDALQGLSFETRTYTLSNEFADNVVCVALTDTASRTYFNGEDIDWGFKYESVRTYGLSEDDLLKGVYVSFTFVLPIHDKQYILDLVDDLRSRQYVAYALPDVIIEGAVYLDANDSYYDLVPEGYSSSQSDIYSLIDLQSAWNITTGSDSVSVGIMDHYLDGGHLDLCDNYGGMEDLYSNYAHDAHGTYVAGVIGAQGDNYTGIAGTCWDVNMISYHVMDKDASGHDMSSYSAIVQAFAVAKLSGVKIMNMSIGFHENNIAVRNAIVGYPGLVVCAAGNEGWNLSTSATRVYPGEYDLDNIIVVAAGNQDDNYRWIGPVKSSNYSGVVDIYAPGEYVFTTAPDDRYVVTSGTSYAAPMVAGVAALMLSIKPNMTGTMLKAALLDQADNLNWGDLGVVKRLNAYNSLSYLVDGHTHSYGYVGDAARHYYMCTICGLGAVGSDHNYSYSHTTESHTSYCSTCGFTPTYMAPYVFRNNSDGTHTYHCSYCDYECFTSAHDFVLANKTATTHAYRCRFCHAYVVSPHTYDCTDNEDGTHTPYCTFCEYVGSPSAHTLNYTNQTGNTHTVSCSDCDYNETVNHNFNIYTSNGSTSHTVSCVCGKILTSSESHSIHYTNYNELYHFVGCDHCNYSHSELHVWVQINAVKYVCSVCGRLAVGVPIVHDNIEIPEGTMSGGGSEGVPFVYQDHWYVLVDGKLYILTEEYGELPLE